MENGYIAETRYVSGDDTLPAGGWIKITSEIYGQLKEIRPGEMARIESGKVIWESATTRPISTEAGKARLLASVIAEDFLSGSGKLLTLLDLLIEHAVCIGLIADPQTEQEKKVLALSKERTIRAKLIIAERRVEVLKNKLSEIEAQIDAAQDIASLRQIVQSIRPAIAESVE